MPTVVLFRQAAQLSTANQHKLGHVHPLLSSKKSQVKFEQPILSNVLQERPTAKNTHSRVEVRPSLAMCTQWGANVMHASTNTHAQNGRQRRTAAVAALRGLPEKKALLC